MSEDYAAELAELDGYAKRLAERDKLPEIHPGEQHSAEWMASRLGNCTASRFAAVMDFTKAGKEGATRAAYRLETVIERITGVSADHYVSPEMEWGILNEAAARMAYEARTGALVVVPGYIKHPSIDKCGGSPDGIVDNHGIIEIKCPKTTTHVKTLLGEPCAYMAQIQGYIWITGRQYCDYVSYDPRLPEYLQLYVHKIERDDEFIAKLEAAVIVFLAEVAAQYDTLRALSMIDTTIKNRREAT